MQAECFSPLQKTPICALHPVSVFVNIIPMRWVKCLRDGKQSSLMTKKLIRKRQLLLIFSLKKSRYKEVWSKLKRLELTQREQSKHEYCGWCRRRKKSPSGCCKNSLWNTLQSLKNYQQTIPFLSNSLRWPIDIKTLSPSLTEGSYLVLLREITQMSSISWFLACSEASKCPQILHSIPSFQFHK